MRFPASTTGRQLPGVGMTITRANIRAVQAGRAKDRLEPLTPEQLADEFVSHRLCKHRHVARAERLMNGGS